MIYFYFKDYDRVCYLNLNKFILFIIFFNFFVNMVVYFFFIFILCIREIWMCFFFIIIEIDLWIK